MASTRTLRVTTVLSEPYVMNKTDGSGFTGFVVDLMDEISERVGFKYQFHLSSDGQYGSLDSVTGRWNGMIGEVARREADIAAADLTITSGRERVVDFTKPFLSQSLRLLVRKPDIQATTLNMSIFLEPFSVELWFSLLVALLVVAILFMVIGQFNPYEWRQVPSDKDPRGARHSFGLRDSLMFIFSTTTLQGYRETPRSLAGRVLAVSWFIFTFLTVIAYIANVIVFNMPASDPNIISMRFNGLDDLGKQTEIKVLTVKGGRSFQKLRNSREEVYRRLARRMEPDPSTLVKTTAEGVARVQTSGERYVMLMESLKADYIANQRCNLMMYGSSHFPSGLGLATPKGSNLHHPINFAILELTEDGTIQELQKHWWYDYGVCPFSRPAMKAQSKFRSSQLSVRHMAIPFLVLLVGAILSVLVLVGEVVFKKLRK